ncbi:MAG: BufA2 family periplasmic bufferin-type metallophore [Burkholderiales bacterium]
MKAIRCGTGVAVAIAAAGLIGCATDPSSPVRQAKVECHGVNECRGQSDCGIARNQCGGGNSCRGQGMKLMSEKDCEAARARFAREAAKG